MKPTTYLMLLCMVLATAACSVAKQGQYSPSQKYSPATLRKDVEAIEHTLLHNHPSLYWYSSREAVAAAFQRAKTSIKDSMDEVAFRNLLNETLAVLHCGHTSVRPSQRYSKAITDRRPVGFPLLLKLIDDSTLAVTVNYNRADTAIRPGMVVHTINNRSAAALIDTLFPLVPIDGFARNFSYQNISNNFSNYYNSRFPNDTAYEVRYTDYNGAVQVKRLRPYDAAKDTFRRRINQQSTAPATRLRQSKLLATRSFTIDSSGNFAVMRLSSFSRLLRPGFIRKSFRKLRQRQVPNLVVDVRSNGGGLINRSLLLTRFFRKEPFVFTDSIFAVRRSLRTPLKVEKKFLNQVGMRLLNRKVNDSVYRFAFFSGRRYQPHRNSFTGQTYILTGGFSFSATTMFLANVKGQPKITLIGEETGGGYYGNNGVFIPDVTLPGTRVRVRLPLYRIVNRKELPNNGSGVLPDVEVKASPTSIRRNQDPKMEKALELIRNSKTSTRN